MHVPITAAVIACLAAADVSGCTQPAQTCAVADYGGGGTSGYRTPRQAPQSVLDVVQNKAGKWNVGGVTACK